MADVKMNDFLLQYFMQRYFNEMPAEVFSTFQDYIKADDDFRGNMKTWKKNLVHEDSGKWVKNALPDMNPPPLPAAPESNPWLLKDGECDKLFNAFQDAFRAMNEDRGAFDKNDDATNFLNENFGDAATKLFSYGVASRDTEQEITQLRGLLNNSAVVQGVLVHGDSILKDAKSNLGDVISGLNSGKYNTDIKFRKLVQDIAAVVRSVVYNDSNLRAQHASDFPHFPNIRDKFEDTEVPPAKRDQFRNEYRLLLDTLYKNSKVRDVFKNYDGGKITGKVDEAKGKIDYGNTSSEDYVPPKRKDELTPWQKASKWVGDTFEDYMEKYTKFRGDRVYFSPQAKLIAKALSGGKVKLVPTDGLAKLIDSGTASEVKKSLQMKSPRAVEHFDWLVKTLGELKDTMPKAFEGALRSGRQLHALIEEIVMKAMQKGGKDDIAKAKTALEILSVFKYGYTTSKIMDALGKQEFSIFSDKNLSWMKKGGPIADVAKIIDKSMHTGLMAVGYSVTALVNAAKLSGSKFKKGQMGRMQGAHDRWTADKDAGLVDATAKRDRENPLDEAARTTEQAEITRLGGLAVDNVTADNLEARKGELTTRRTASNNTLTALNEARANRVTAAEKAREAIQRRQNAQKIIDDYNRLQDGYNDMQTQITQLDTDIAALETEANDPATFAGLTPQAEAIRRQVLTDQIRTAKDSRTQLQSQAQQALQELNNPLRIRVRDGAVNAMPQRDLELRNAQAELRRVNAEIHNAENAYNAAHTSYESLNTNVSQFETASERVQELTERIEKRNQVIAEWDDKHKDGYLELMEYWNFLETGRNRHGGKMYSWRMGSAKLKQEVFDRTKDAQFAQWQRDHSMAA